MLTVRLQRVGRKNDPSYRMVIIDSKRGVKSADYVENVGSYNPRQKGNTKIDGERVKHWISVGAKPTDTVHNLLINEKIITGKKVNPLGKKTPIIAEKKEEDSGASEGASEKDAEDSASTEEPKAEATEDDASKEEEPKEEEKKEPAPEPEEKKKEAKPAEEPAPEEAAETKDDKKE